MTAMGIVPALDVAEDGHLGRGVGAHDAPVEQFALEAGEKTLAHGVVEGVAYGRHRGYDACVSAPLAEGYRGVLAAVIRVEIPFSGQ